MWSFLGPIWAFALIVAATGLFLTTALAGRLFCGFACPQTVYTMIFTWIEARVEGDHLARLKLDRSPNGPRKLALRFEAGAWALLSADADQWEQQSAYLKRLYAYAELNEKDIYNIRG